MNLKRIGKVTIESGQIRILDPALAEPGEGTYCDFSLSDGECPVYEFEHDNIRYVCFPVGGTTFQAAFRVMAGMQNGSDIEPK